MASVMCTAKLLSQDFCGVIEPFWSMNCSKLSLVQVLIMKAIMPCTKERSGHARLDNIILPVEQNRMFSHYCGIDFKNGKIFDVGSFALNI